MSTSLTQVIGLIDFVGSLVLLWAGLRVTNDAGLSSPQKFWALLRRLFYCSMALAMFGLSTYRIDAWYQIDVFDFLCQLTVVIGILIFPLLRAFGLISQDTFIVLQGWRRPTTR